MDIMKYITEQSLILIPVLYIIGMAIKETSLKDNYIPWILMVLGALGAMLMQGFTIGAFIQGILVAGATVYTNQLIKQTKELK